MVTCPNCGEINGNDRETCFKCHAQLKEHVPALTAQQMVCPYCKLSYNSNTIYCKECGSRLMKATENTTGFRRALTSDDAPVKTAPVFSMTSYVKDFEVDEDHQLWVINKGVFRPAPQKFSDIVSFELLEDNDTVMKGGVGRALVGGALFGGVGAIVGSNTRKSKSVCNMLRVKITVSNMNIPPQYVDFITSPTKTDSFIYKSAYNDAQRCLSLLQVICDKVNAAKQEEMSKANTTTAQPAFSAADEIMKFKQLLDMGAITQEEFDAKKKQLLGL